jgi:hypothetical protein
MSSILESRLDAERREACRLNDAHIARGEPCGCIDSIISTDTPSMAQAQPLLRATHRMAMIAVIKIGLCSAVLGFAAGHLVGTTSSPTPIVVVKPDPRDMHHGNDVHPAPTMPRSPQRMEV